MQPPFLVAKMGCDERRAESECQKRARTVVEAEGRPDKWQPASQRAEMRGLISFCFWLDDCGESLYSNLTPRHGYPDGTPR